MWHRASSPRVPDDLRIYAIGDIHGRLDLLDRLLGLIDRDVSVAARKPVIRVFVGDYIDRGPDSFGVIARLLALQRQDPNAVFLRGNHEQMMLEFLQTPASYARWRGLGAEDTLLSYNVAPPIFEDERAFGDTHEALMRALPAAHLAFLNATRHFYISGDYLFVHAGIRPGVFLSEQQPHDMMWIREEFLSSRLTFEKFVVHGHSPTGKPEIRRNRIGIDTRAFRTGRLTALCLEGKKRRFVSASVESRPKRA